jgi:hypothetical protein
MNGQLPPHLADAMIDERLRSASERRASRVAAAGRQAPSDLDAHGRQRMLVRASVLLSRRSDPATSRRWA